MKPTLQLKLSQQLKLTPQLQQSIKLLQLSTLELNQELERIIQQNPLLEINENWNTHSLERLETAYADNDVQQNTAVNHHQNSLSTEHSHNLNWPEDGFYPTPQDKENTPYQLAAEPIKLREHLNQQNNLSQNSEKEKRIISLLIDSLDDDGYLTQDLNELREILPAELNISLDNLTKALTQLQHLDPPGIGARNLKECLLLQLNALPEDTPYRSQAIKIVSQYLDVFASHNYVLIKKLLKCDDDSLRAIKHLITHLNPKPGSNFDTPNTRYIIPDIIVTKVNGIWTPNLNMDAMPRININHFYANILKQKREESSRELSNQLTEAKWLIKNLQQRSSTILKVSTAIVERQQQFFEHGEIAMRPLVLREIAETLELHESTVSRVTTQKFMHTPRGNFELKYFFGSHVATDSGGTCSATAIRALIKQLIQKENTKKPLSDNKIAGILEEQGIVVARRTIAKYRESMQIPPANLRKLF